MITTSGLGSLNAKRARKKKNLPKGKPLKGAGVSWACLNGLHPQCASLKCQCKCGHMGVNVK